MRDAKRTVWNGWPAVVLFTAGLVAAGCWFGLASEHDASEQAGVIVVRSAAPSDDSTPVMPKISPSVQVVDVPQRLPDDAQNIVSAISAKYPMLKNPVFACSAGRCELTGEMDAPVSNDDLDRRQEMLLGGLERLLSASNHRILAAIQMDETGDEEYRIKVDTD